MNNQKYYNLSEDANGVISLTVLPDDLQEDLKVKEETTIAENGLRTTIISHDNLMLICTVGPKDIRDFGQLYYNNSGKLVVDTEWSHVLMSLREIKQKQLKRLLELLDEELAKDSPDSIIAAKLTRDIIKLPTLPQKEIYKIALDSLQYADSKKTAIKKKLKAKIDELESMESK